MSILVIKLSFIPMQISYVARLGLLSSLEDWLKIGSLTTTIPSILAQDGLSFVVKDSTPPS